MFGIRKSIKYIVLLLMVTMSVMFFSGCPETLPPVAGSVSVSLSLSGNAGGEPYVKQVSFSAETATVEVTVNSALSSIFIELAAELSGASLSVGGQALTSGSSISIDLSYGTTTVAVVVTPDDGDAVSYTLKITRPEPVYSDNADLTALELSVGYLDPQFASSVISYESSVPDDTESITVTAVLSDSAASMTVNGAAAVSGAESGPVALVTGSNIVSVKVTAEDGETLKTYTIDVERRAAADAVAPVLSLLGDDPMTVSYGSDFTDPGATATDNVDGTWTVYSEDEVDTSTPDDYTLTYNATDLDGNAAESITRTVTVIDPPPIEIPEAYYFWDNSTGYLYQSNPGDDSYSVVTNSGSTVDSGTMVEYDNDANYGIALSGEEYFKVEWTEPVDGVFEQSWTAGYFTVNAARTAAADERTATAYISADLVPPVIYLNGDASMSVEVGGDFTDPEATVRDWGINDDYTITASDDDEFDIDTPDTYVFTYSETDTDGNSAVWVTRTVEVVASLDYNGLYGGSTEILSSTTGNPEDSNAGVWTLEVNGSTATVTFLTVTGEYTATGTLNSSTGDFSLNHDFTAPQVVTADICGVVDSDGTVEGLGTYDYGSDSSIDETFVLSGEKNSSGYIVRGTMSLPEGVDWSGAAYWAALDTDQDGGNGQVATGGGYCSTSNSMCFLITNVPSGSYYLYGAVNTSGTFGQPLSGDYSGYYGASTVSINSSTGVYNFSIHPDYSSLIELGGTWYLPDDGYGTQEYEFYSDGSQALLHWGRPNLSTPEYEGHASMAYIDGDLNTAVLYLYDHPDPSQENSYAKFVWTEPVTGASTTSDFSIYQSNADFQTALSEINLQSESYPLTADTEAP